MSNDIKHIGTQRHSGRYPWGSGSDSYQRTKSFLASVKELEDKGLSEIDVAKGMGLSTTELRSRKSIAKSEERKEQYYQALKMKDKGFSNVAIGKKLGLNESSVRSLLNPAIQERSDITETISTMLKDQLNKKPYIDVGTGVETYIGVSRTKLNIALEKLKNEGYGLHYIDVRQVGTGKYTLMKVLTKPDVPYKEVYENRDQISLIGHYSEDGGRSFLGLKPVRNISSDSIQIRYREDGGSDKDGVIELRRGVPELSLGSSRYAQVRIGVDGTHYLKGMAMYSDNMPEGKNVIFNTNKPKGTPPDKVFKSMKDDPDNPFGSIVKQKTYIDKDGKEQQSALNIVNEEGDWTTWSKSLSSQVLSKQRPSLAKEQLGLAYDLKEAEFDEISSLTNPAVKKRLLDSFSEVADSSAVHLKAAALPRQASHVLLPFPGMKENEIYAPGYDNGERVALIRHPHGGIFEIPELVVNNKYPEAKSVISNAIDAVGIHPNVAKKLSGADFDGDTVLVIPNKSGAIKSSPTVKSLIDFDTKLAYPPYDGMKTIDGGIYREATGKVDYGGKKPRTGPKQMKMGDVSNLITDMTIKGANLEEITRAVKHSMVVIDSEKHSLNYKQSYIDNGIPALKKKYQGSERAGASTLLSKASSEIRVPHRKERVIIDPLTGRKIYQYSGKMTLDKYGKEVPKTTKITRMEKETDAFALSSGTKMEEVYALHANKLKALANRARKLSLETDYIPYSPSARETYAKEVASLKEKLNVAIKHRPIERQAQLLANKIVTLKKQANPEMDKDSLKKIRSQALTEARARSGPKKSIIEITDKEWDAIQAGAISNNTLTQILLNCDLEAIKKRATPRASKALNSSKMSKAKYMLSAGYTQAEVANALGVSVSFLNEQVNI